VPGKRPDVALTAGSANGARSLALRRDPPRVLPHVAALHQALKSEALVVTTGLVLQELLQGFAGPRGRKDIIEHFGALPMISPSREDHIAAAELRNTCRRAGVQMGTIDALLAQLFYPSWTDAADNRQRLQQRGPALPVEGLVLTGSNPIAAGL